MAKRKLVNIGISPKLPTIAEFFEAMADNQREEIRRLKHEHLGDAAVPKGSVKKRKKGAKAEATGEITPYPWLLHPVRKRPRRKKRG